ncbi:hypothetical protein A2U01_0016982 [Trifolium medium]|uniref:Uncharacterized protein n=1 Tax=Trifolium medium TaxID=97028 RepID=A0A392N9T0_9FABA|nr:hypothetical protein [Trifolium medium]
MWDTLASPGCLVVRRKWEGEIVIVWEEEQWALLGCDTMKAVQFRGFAGACGFVAWYHSGLKCQHWNLKPLPQAQSPSQTSPSS